MEEPFDYEKATTQLQARMTKYRLKNIWMISQLKDEGIQVTEGSFSRIIRNFTHSDYAKSILEMCGRILDDYERLFLDEMKRSRENSLPPDGWKTYEIIYDYCPTDDDTEEKRNLSETFHGTWDELQSYTKEMQKTGYYNIHAHAVMAPEGIEEDAEIGGQNLPAENLEIEEKRKKADRENEIFEYEGYHFEPVGSYEESEREGFWRACAADMYVVDGFMEDEPGAKPMYVKDFFYARAGVPEDEVNLFRCIETGKILVAGEISLFVYDDFVRQGGKYTPYNKESKKTEMEETISRPAVSGPKRRGR